MYIRPFDYSSVGVKRCFNHPSYNVMRKPSGNCNTCVQLWELRNVIEDMITNQIKIGNPTLAVVAEYIEYIQNSDNTSVTLGEYFLYTRNFLIEWPSLQESSFKKAIVLIDEWHQRHNYTFNPLPTRRKFL